MTVGISIAEYNPLTDSVQEHQVKTDSWWSFEMQEVFVDLARMELPVYGYANGDIIAITEAYQKEYAKIQDKS